MKYLKVILLLNLFTGALIAQNDTIYFMKNGLVINKQSIKPVDMDSCIFYDPTLFTDTRDGNVYRTVKIGNQTWLAENLRYLPSVSGYASGSYSSPYYYVYGYNGTDVNAAKATSNYSIYGVLYNWDAARISCPPGWHLPTDQEWTELETYLGGGAIAGGKLKETGTSYWLSPNNGSTNETKFNARGAGVRSVASYFGGIGETVWYWSNTPESSGNSYGRYISYDQLSINRAYLGKGHGVSVRCVKD